VQLRRGFSSGRWTEQAGRASAAARAPAWLAAVAAGLAGGVGVQLYMSKDAAECRAAEQPSATAVALKEYEKEEVAKHRTKETGRVVGVIAYGQFQHVHPLSFGAMPDGATRMQLPTNCTLHPLNISLAAGLPVRLCCVQRPPLRCRWHSAISPW
jgi:hypothetical protein